MKRKEILERARWVPTRTTSFGVIIGSGVVLSFIMAHPGAMIGRCIFPTENPTNI